MVDWCETSTGAIHAALLLAAADWTLSVLDTAIASKPLNASSERVAPKFDVRLA